MNKCDKKNMSLSLKSSFLLYFMPNEHFPTHKIVSPPTKEEIAWSHTLSVKDWIWKCIQKRNIPECDQEDAYTICQIEVYKLMLRYNPAYSVTTWASYGILKGLTRYESTSGTIRLPIHVIEKVNRLHKHQYMLSKQGLEMTPQDMEKYIGLNILDILTAREKKPLIDTAETQDFFNQKNLVHSRLINGSCKTAEEQVIEADDRRILYKSMHMLYDYEIYVLLHRYALNHQEIPYRKNFFNQKSDLCILAYIQDSRIYSLNELGLMIGYSKERIRQIEVDAINKVRNKV
jgi:RNA polymerase primary sigma factor